jgi:low temperature requirement protein LtrA
MADDPSWAGLAKGMLVLGVLWWAWVGYAWLTSVVDPEEGFVRLAIFAAMAGLLVAALCVPAAFEQSALLFAGAYGVVRFAQVALLAVAGRDDPDLRRSVLTGLLGSTTIGVGLLVAAAFADGALQGALWAAALLLDMAGPLLFGSEGWKLMPSHFAERHGLIVIIALGESIVAIGVGAEVGVDAGVVAAAVLGIAIAATLWWLYFDVVARVAEQRLTRAAAGREQNEMARDSYSFLHLPMVAGIVLLALGLKKTLGDVADPLKLVPAVATLGGTAMYLLAHVASGGATCTRSAASGSCARRSWSVCCQSRSLSPRSPPGRSWRVCSSRSSPTRRSGSPSAATRSVTGSRARRRRRQAVLAEAIDSSVNQRVTIPPRRLAVPSRTLRRRTIPKELP